MTINEKVVLSLALLFFSCAFLILGIKIGSKQTDCPDLPNPTAALQTQVDVLRGQMQATTDRYNDYGDRLQTIEDRMHIFNEEKK